jgi:hypothetical protein
MMPTITTRWIALLFTATTFLHLLPIWRVHYVPTMDGPSHLYNAVVMQELGAGSPEFARVFQIDTRPYPNWMSHALLWLALTVAPPLVAEKLVLSAIVLLFLAGCWMLAGAGCWLPACEAGRGSRVYAFLAMPLAFNLLLQLGFYNFMLATALMMIGVAYWWRTSTIDHTSLRPSIILAALLVLSYFAHPIPTAVAILFISVSTIALRRRMLLTHLAFAPALLLLTWFVLRPSAEMATWNWNGVLMWQPLTRVLLLLTLDLRQIAIGTAMGIVFGLLIVLTIVIENIDRQRLRAIVRDRDVFLLLTAIAIILYLAAPLGANGDLMLKARFLLFPYLIVLPWLTPRLGRVPLAIVFALLAAANVFFIRDGWKRNDKFIARAIAPLYAAEPNRTMLALVFDRSSPHATVAVLSHAVSYAAAERRLVDLGNYEAATGHFPVAFRESIVRPNIFAIESTPQDFDPTPHLAMLDYIYTWKMPAGSALETRLFEHYELVAAEGEAHLYRRRH